MGIQKERMLAGEVYIAEDPKFAAGNQRVMALMEEINASCAANCDARIVLLHDLLGSIGPGSEIWPPMYCDDRKHINIGSGTFISREEARESAAR